MSFTIFRVAVRNRTPEARFSLARIFWASMVFSVFLYFPIPGFFGGGRVSRLDLPVAMFWLLPLMAGIQLGLQGYHRILLTDRRLFPRLRDPQGRFFPGAEAKAPLSLPREEQGRQAIFLCWVESLMLQWAMAVSIAVYGFILFLMSGDSAWFYPFGILGAVDLLVFLPRKRPILDQVERWKRSLKSPSAGRGQG